IVPVAILVHGLRFRVGHVDGVVAIDENPAGPSELFPLGDKLAVLVEDLDAVISAIPYEKPPARIHGERVRSHELPWTGPCGSPLLDELSALVEFHDPRIQVSRRVTRG